MPQPSRIASITFLCTMEKRIKNRINNQQLTIIVVLIEMIKRTGLELMLFVGIMRTAAWRVSRRRA